MCGLLYREHVHHRHSHGYSAMGREDVQEERNFHPSSEAVPSLVSNPEVMLEDEGGAVELSQMGHA